VVGGQWDPRRVSRLAMRRLLLNPKMHFIVLKSKPQQSAESLARDPGGA